MQFIYVHMLIFQNVCFKLLEMFENLFLILTLAFVILQKLKKKMTFIQPN